MIAHPNRLGLNVIAVVTAFGIGCLVWILGHLMREARPPRRVAAHSMSRSPREAGQTPEDD
jgi:hypothetical protein